MRTTLEIDDDLLQALRAQYPALTRKDAVDKALREHLRSQAYEKLRSMFGTMDGLRDVSKELRMIDRHT